MLNAIGTLLDSLQIAELCDGLSCSAPESHFETHVRFVVKPGGGLSIAGVFNTNSLVEEARAKAIGKTLDRWDAAIDERFKVTKSGK